MVSGHTRTLKSFIETAIRQFAFGISDMKSAFDTPNKKSLLQVKEHWEEQLEMDRNFLKGEDLTEEEKQSTYESIAIAEENLKDINADLIEIEAELGEIETS